MDAGTDYKAQVLFWCPLWTCKNVPGIAHTIYTGIGVRIALTIISEQEAWRRALVKLQLIFEARRTDLVAAGIYGRPTLTLSTKFTKPYHYTTGKYYPPTKTGRDFVRALKDMIGDLK